MPGMTLTWLFVNTLAQDCAAAGGTIWSRSPVTINVGVWRLLFRSSKVPFDDVNCFRAPQMEGGMQKLNF